jgi:hypothetical protein
MKRMMIAGFILMAVCAICLAKAEVKSPDAGVQERAAILIKQLSDNELKTRETAQAELTKIGRIIKPLIQSALKNSADLETQIRLSSILKTEEFKWGETAGGLRCFIRSDKEIYDINEPIFITFAIQNTSDKPKEYYRIQAGEYHYDNTSVLVSNSRGREFRIRFYGSRRKSFPQNKALAPGEIFKHTDNLLKWDSRSITDTLSPNTYTLTAAYKWYENEGAKNIEMDIVSDQITITILNKRAEAKMMPLETNGNFVLYVSNQSYAIGKVDIKISIDGTLAVNDIFDVGNQHSRKSYEFQLAKGAHKIKIESGNGSANLEKEFAVNDKHWATVYYWYYPEGGYNPTPRQFSFLMYEKPIMFE